MAERAREYVSRMVDRPKETNRRARALRRASEPDHDRSYRPRTAAKYRRIRPAIIGTGRRNPFLARAAFPCAEDAFDRRCAERGELQIDVLRGDKQQSRFLDILHRLLGK